MKDVWRRVEAWLSAHAKRIHASLGPPAGDERIATAERLLGVSFPADFRESLRIHDGQSAEVPFMASWVLLSCRDIVEQWRIWKDLLDGGHFAKNVARPSGPVRAEWWNPGWIPVTHDGGGDHHCLDLAPAPGGRAGQIVTLWHDSGDRKVLASGFGAWLGAFADDLEAGKYSYEEKRGLRLK